MLLAGDNSEIMSSRLPSGKYWIHNKDGSRIEDAFDKVFHPVLIKDPETWTNFYNCPGFGIERTPEDNFVGRKPGGNRGDFLFTLQEISDLIHL